MFTCLVSNPFGMTDHPDFAIMAVDAIHYTLHIMQRHFCIFQAGLKDSSPPKKFNSVMYSPSHFQTCVTYYGKQKQTF